MSLRECSLIELPKITDSRGSLTVIEDEIPFEIKRVFYLYDSPAEVSRGGHAHKTCHQFLICLVGSCNVRLDDGTTRGTMRLNRPWRGVYIPPMIWVDVYSYDLDTVLLVLCSEKYDEGDYIRDHKEFVDER